MQQDFSRRIRGSALQMRDLVLNLLEISRLESGMAMNLEILDLHELLEEAVRELRDQALAKGHSLEMEFCEASPQVTGDRGLLMQLARNLLSNAIKYTPEDGHICVATRLDEAAVVIKFQDTGVGIPEDDLPLIWEKFFRVHSNETRDIEGTGLGLAIVKSIVENHRGEINVQSVTGEGSSFEVQLPLQVHA